MYSNKRVSTLKGRVTVGNVNGGKDDQGVNIGYDTISSEPQGDFILTQAQYAEDAGISLDPGKRWKRPEGTTWHHHEDCRTMLLVESSVHSEIRHTGGASHLRNGTC